MFGLQHDGEVLKSFMTKTFFLPNFYDRYCDKFISNNLTKSLVTAYEDSVVSHTNYLSQKIIITIRIKLNIFNLKHFHIFCGRNRSSYF